MDWYTGIGYKQLSNFYPWLLIITVDMEILIKASVILVFISLVAPQLGR